MNMFVIFGKGNNAADRFTIINRETADIFGACEKPNALNWTLNLLMRDSILIGLAESQVLRPCQKIFKSTLPVGRCKSGGIAIRSQRCLYVASQNDEASAFAKSK